MTGIPGSALDPQGPAAESIAGLWWLMLGLGVAVFTLVAVLLVVGLFRRRPAEGSEAEAAEEDDPRRTRRWIIGGGVVLPVVVIGIVLGATVGTMREVSTAAPSGALVVEIIGHQWWWEVRYPEERVTTANELHIPVGRPVAVELRSADVIHSFWVPALAGKLDAIPDKVNTLVLEADQAGEHRSECAEFCGLQHRNMKLIVTAEPEAAFRSWISLEQRPAGEPVTAEARRGRDVFLRAGCASCHTVRGVTVAVSKGPDLTHIARRPTLGAGALENTADDLADWVADPHESKVGVLMPKPDITDEQLRDLLAYLAGLE